PTAEELTVAKKQTATLLDEVLKTPGFWLGRLAALDYRGLTIDDVLEAQEQYQRFTAQDVQDAFVRYDKPEARLRFVITPKSKRPCRPGAENRPPPQHALSYASPRIEGERRLEPGRPRAERPPGPASLNGRGAWPTTTSATSTRSRSLAISSTCQAKRR